MYNFRNIIYKNHNTKKSYIHRIFFIPKKESVRAKRRRLQGRFVRPKGENGSALLKNKLGFQYVGCFLDSQKKLVFN